MFLFYNFCFLVFNFLVIILFGNIKHENNCVFLSYFNFFPMKAENLHSLERTEWMMVRWMCGVSLKDRLRIVDLYSLLGIQSVTNVWGEVDWGGLGIWSLRVWCFGVACRKVEVAGMRCRGGIRRLVENVWMMKWKCLVCGPSGQNSGICGGTSYGQPVN